MRSRSAERETSTRQQAARHEPIDKPPTAHHVVALQRSVGNRAVAQLVGRLAAADEGLLDQQASLQRQTPDAGTQRPSLPAVPAHLRPLSPPRRLVIYTTGDTRRLRRTRGRQLPNAPQTYEALYRRRAQDVAGANSIVMSFNSRQEATDWLNRPENRETINEIVFVGHGNTGVFAFSVEVEGRNVVADPDQMLDFNTPDTTLVQAVRNVAPVSVAPASGGGAPASTRNVSITVEACETGAGTLTNFGNVMAQEGLSGRLEGYDVEIETRWLRTGRIGIFGVDHRHRRVRDLERHRRTFDIRPQPSAQPSPH